MKKRIALRGLFRERRGATMVVVAVSMAVLLGFSALVIDMGTMYMEKSRLQNALDAAALAGAQSLPSYSDAAAAAQKYFTGNGFTADKMTVSFPDSGTITCSGEAAVQTTFARVLGINSTTTSPLHATAIKTDRRIKSPFDYGVFQGEPGALLDMGGAAFTVDGGVFSNGTFRSKPGGTTTITSVETVSDDAPDTLGCVHIGSVSTDADPIDMVDMQSYFDGLKDAAVTGKTFTAATSSQLATWKKAWQSFTVSGCTTVNGDLKTGGQCVVDGTLVVNGDYTASGLRLTSGSVLIVNGDLSWAGYAACPSSIEGGLIYVTGSISAFPGGTGTTFSGQNNIYAAQNMTLGGSGIYTTDSTFFYCQNGSLTVTAQCGSMYLTGILYSYNGTVVLQSTPNIYGAVIGRYIDSFPGGLTIEYPSNGLGFSFTEAAYKLTD